MGQLDESVAAPVEQSMAAEQNGVAVDYQSKPADAQSFSQSHVSIFVHGSSPLPSASCPILQTFTGETAFSLLRGLIMLFS